MFPHVNTKVGLQGSVGLSFEIQPTPLDAYFHPSNAVTCISLSAIPLFYGNESKFLIILLYVPKVSKAQ
jgi:hypothetical protein